MKNFQKKRFVLAICAGLSLTTNIAFAEPTAVTPTAVAPTAVTPITAAALGKLILNKAKSKFISAVGGKISSLFIDAIFGSSGPSYVNLSEESLQAIQDRVRMELVGSAEFEYIAYINSFQLGIRDYSASAEHGRPDMNILSILTLNSNDLTTHYSLNSQFNNEYFYLADSFALVASLAVSVQVERYLQGHIPFAHVRSRANELANQLELLLVAKKSADLPLRERCRITTGPREQYREERCNLRDPHGNPYGSAEFNKSDRYWEEDVEEWDIDMQIIRRDYHAEHFIGIEEVISRLRNF